MSNAYCSDTLYNEDILPVIQEASLLYHEATFKHDLVDRANETYHTTALQAGMIAKTAAVTQLLICHFSARYTDLQPLLDEARQNFPDAQLALEGFRFDV